MMEELSKFRNIEAHIDKALAAGNLDDAEALAASYCQSAGLDNTDAEPARSPRFRSTYLAAQVALAAGRLGQALERLAPLLAVTNRLPAELAAQVRLFAAEALARLHRHTEARELLDQVPDDVLRPQPLLHLRALRIRLWLDEVGGLAPDLARCARSLEAAGETANLALLVCEEGRAWGRARDLARAEQCWLRAERLSKSLGADPIRADVLLQLGRLNHVRGHLAVALDWYEAALGCASKGPQALEIRLRRLLVCLDINQGDLAPREAERLLGETSPDQFPEEIRPLAAMVQALLADAAPVEPSDELRAYREAAHGDAAAARRLYRAALEATASPPRQARLALALGLLALTQNDRVEADSWLHRAEEIARSLDLPEVLTQALQARGQIAARFDKDDARARRLFEEAVVVAEVQASQFSQCVDVPAYRQRGGTVLRQLLRAACRRGDAAGVFRYQELERGRLLLDLWRAGPPSECRQVFLDLPELADLEERIAGCVEELTHSRADPEQRAQRRALVGHLEELQFQQDRLLEEFLRDRSRRTNAALPGLPDLGELQKALPPGTLYLAPVVDEEALYLLAASRDGPAQVLRGQGSAAGFRDAVDGLRGCLAGQLARYQHGLSLGRHERAELDGRLADLNRGPLGDALSQVLGGEPSPRRRLLWVPDGALHGLPIHALRRPERYLIEDHEVVWTFSGALFVHQARTRKQTRGRFRPALVVTEAPAVLPRAADEGRGVAGSFPWSRTLHGAAATRDALHARLGRARAVHFACHAHFDTEHPLAACLALPSGEWMRAVDWLHEPVAGLPLGRVGAAGGSGGLRPGDWPLRRRGAGGARRPLACGRPRGIALHVALLPHAPDGRPGGGACPSPAGNFGRARRLSPVLGRVRPFRRRLRAAGSGLVLALAGTLAAAPAPTPLPAVRSGARPPTVAARDSHGTPRAATPSNIVRR
jgi:hypothetical protein